VTEPHTVRVASGKYTFVKTTGDKPIQILRHDEPWHEQTDASNALASIMAELDAARVVLAEVRAILAMGMPVNTRERLEHAIQRHAALVTDDEQPSAWCRPTASEPAAAADATAYTCLDCGSRLGTRAAAIEHARIAGHRIKGLFLQWPVQPAAGLNQLATRAHQWAAAERQADDAVAALEIAATAAARGSSTWNESADYARAHANARVAGQVEDNTREMLLEAARELAYPKELP
jgi:hypothetical protein